MFDSVIAQIQSPIPPQSGRHMCITPNLIAVLMMHRDDLAMKFFMVLKYHSANNNNNN